MPASEKMRQTWAALAASIRKTRHVTPPQPEKRCKLAGGYLRHAVCFAYPFEERKQALAAWGSKLMTIVSDLKKVKAATPGK